MEIQERHNGVFSSDCCRHDDCEYADVLYKYTDKHRMLVYLFDDCRCWSMLSTFHSDVAFGEISAHLPQKMG